MLGIEAGMICRCDTLIGISISHISIVLIENARQTFFVLFAREVFRHCARVKRKLCFYLIVSVYPQCYEIDSKCEPKNGCFSVK